MKKTSIPAKKQSHTLRNSLIATGIIATGIGGYFAVTKIMDIATGSDEKTSNTPPAVIPQTTTIRFPLKYGDGYSGGVQNTAVKNLQTYLNATFARIYNSAPNKTDIDLLMKDNGFQLPLNVTKMLGIDGQFGLKTQKLLKYVSSYEWDMLTSTVTEAQFYQYVKPSLYGLNGNNPNSYMFF